MREACDESQSLSPLRSGVSTKLHCVDITSHLVTTPKLCIGCLKRKRVIVSMAQAECMRLVYHPYPGCRKKIAESKLGCACPA